MTNKINQNAFLTARKLCPTILPHRIGVLAQIERFASEEKTGAHKANGNRPIDNNTLSPEHLPFSHAVRAQVEAIRASKRDNGDTSVSSRSRSANLRPLLVAENLPNRAAVLAQISALRGEKARRIAGPKFSKVRFETKLA